MGGNHSRRKGGNGERELTALLPGAVKVSWAWKPGHDIEWMGYDIECKRYAEPISKRLTRLLDDVPIVMERADRGEWVAHLRVSDLLDLIDTEQPSGT